MVQPVVLLSAICFITVALGSEESCYLTEEQEDDCAAVCHPIVKPLLRYFEKIQAKESQFQKENSELQKKLQQKGLESLRNYSDLQKKYSDLQESYSDLRNRKVIEVENLKSQIGSKNVEIKFLKDKISELNKTNELATKILRDDIAKLREIVKNKTSNNGTASPLPTRTVQQQAPPSKAIPDRCPQSQNETEIIQEIQIPGSDPFKVVCYSDEEIGSGWLIVYNHWDKTNYFNRTYEEFERGIGDVGTQWDDNYFIGLERLHLLTSRNSYELRMNPYKCDSFIVGNQSEGYMVKDTKGCTGGILPNLRQVKFSTWDRDEDGYPDRSLAKEIGYGWWIEPRIAVFFFNPFFGLSY
ncbi:angiopoietin-related protein 3-like [Drosophila bipectinata]|uniref:angiopoietin-related protein 3-like n=1 Tax=Drosophila bipectinata TaxID=42026 RepID=UPI001C8AC487|nr:angiopoietin-related protein 3-like [Drosophila bipectinata]